MLNMNSLERVAILGLLNDLQHTLVQTEGECSGEDGQSRIGDDGHD